MDRRDWWATVHGVAKGRTQLSNFTFTFTFTYCFGASQMVLVVKNLPAKAGDLRDVGLNPG